VLCVSFEIDDHGGCRVNTAQTLNQWRHSMALSEALDVLHHQAMHALYHRICMAIKIATDLPAFFIVLDFVVANNLR
jgi:hypothetical protein